MSRKFSYAIFIKATIICLPNCIFSSPCNIIIIGQRCLKNRIHSDERLVARFESSGESSTKVPIPFIHEAESMLLANEIVQSKSSCLLHYK